MYQGSEHAPYLDQGAEWAPYVYWGAGHAPGVRLRECTWCILDGWVYTWFILWGLSVDMVRQGAGCVPGV